MKKYALWTTCGVFLAFISLFFLFHLILPDRDFSEQENRSLQRAPEFSLDALISGEFMSDFETYSADQFALRDQWISMKARLELILGKGENNGVFLCDNETLLEPFHAPTVSDLDSRVYAINTLGENTGVPVYLGLIPSAAEIYRDMIPAGVQNDDQLALIDYVYNNTTATPIDFASQLTSHADEYIYYRTDHHWTSLGAFYGYNALCEAMGISVTPITSYERKIVSEGFYGTTYSTSGFAWVKPDTMEIFVEQPDNVFITRYEGAEGIKIPLYDESRLLVKDKYSYYLGGNTPRLVVERAGTTKPSLLIIRDSYCDSLTPFLLEDFSQIHILDLRYYRDSIASYVQENNIDEILVLYSVSNFSTDRNIVLLTR